MVTRIITRRIISSKERAAAKDSDRDDFNRLKDNKQSDDDDKKHGSNEAGGGGAQKLCNFKSSQSKAAYRGICDVRSSYHYVFFKPKDNTLDDDGKPVDIHRDSSATRKRPLMTDDVDDTETKGSQRQRQKFINLTGVPPKLPILSNGKGTSKYQGVYFDKLYNKWRAQIRIDGKKHHIGYYDTDKEAAVDYARAVFKYEAGKVNAPRKRGQQNAIDLTDVPAQPPILKSIGMGCTSKYRGVYLHKPTNKWRAGIMIDGKQHHIGCYANEEDAAVDYARAVFKYNKY